MSTSTQKAEAMEYPTKVQKIINTFERYGFTIDDVEVNQGIDLDFLTSTHYWVRASIDRGGNGLSTQHASAGIMVTWRKGGRTSQSFAGGTFWSTFSDHKAKTWRDLDSWAYILGEGIRSKA